MISTYSDALELFNKGITLDNYQHYSKVPDEMYWKSAAEGQIKKVKALAELCNITEEPRVIEKHTSKSCPLPVSMFHLSYFTNSKAFVIIRDNFYDIKMSVISMVAINLPYEMVHLEMTQEKFDEEKQDAINYTGRTESKKEYNWDTDKWYKKYTGDTLIRSNGKIYRAYTVNSVYCEGINRLELDEDVFTAYEDGKKLFTMSIGGYPKACLILNKIYHSVERGQHDYAERERNDSKKS